MADPLDKINKETLKALKNNTVVYDNLFSESPLKIRYMPLVVRRQVDYGVPYAKALLVYEEMIKAGTIERELEPGPESISWSGDKFPTYGDISRNIQEPFTYGPPKETKE